MIGSNENEWMTVRAMNGLRRIGAVTEFGFIDWAIVIDSDKWAEPWRRHADSTKGLPLFYRLETIKQVGGNTAREIEMVAWLTAYRGNNPHHPSCREYIKRLRTAP